MIRRRRRLWVRRTVLLSLLALPIALVYLNVSGMCWKTRHFLTDEDAIRAAIESGILPSQGEETGFADARQLPYRDSAEFVAVNPDCCSTTDLSSSEGRLPPPTFSQRAFGFVHKTVNVRYLQRYVDAAGNIVSRPAQKFVPVSACGVTS